METALHHIENSAKFDFNGHLPVIFSGSQVRPHNFIRWPDTANPFVDLAKRKRFLRHDEAENF